VTASAVGAECLCSYRTSAWRGIPVSFHQPSCGSPAGLWVVACVERHPGGGQLWTAELHSVPESPYLHPCPPLDFRFLGRSIGQPCKPTLFVSHPPLHISRCDNHPCKVTSRCDPSFQRHLTGPPMRGARSHLHMPRPCLVGSWG
jgi:hypothetical protein